MSKWSSNIVLLLLLMMTLFINVSMFYYRNFQTSLLPGTFILYNGNALQANTWSVPLVSDMNNDGLKDLVVGNRTYNKEGPSLGLISYFENKGTDGHPVFNNVSYMQICTDSCMDLSVVPDG